MKLAKIAIASAVLALLVAPAFAQGRSNQAPGRTSDPTMQAPGQRQGGFETPAQGAPPPGQTFNTPGNQKKVKKTTSKTKTSTTTKKKTP